MNGKAALTTLILLTLLACGGVSRAEQKLWFEPRAKVLPLDKPGQFVQLKDGSLLTVGHNFAITSAWTSVGNASNCRWHFRKTTATRGPSRW